MIRLVILEREKYLYHHVHQFLALSHSQIHSGFCSQVISFDWILSSLISSKEEMHWFTLTHCKNNFISLTKMAGPEECAPSAQGWCLSKSLNFWWTNASKCLEHLWFMVFKTWFFTITFLYLLGGKNSLLFDVWLLTLAGDSPVHLWVVFVFCFEMR